MVASTLHEEIIAPSGPKNPRNGEGAIIPLQDGRLLLAWTRFISGGSDSSPAEIWARESQDGGRTWKEPYILQPNIGVRNVMSVSFLRLASGDLLFGYIVKNDERNDCRFCVRRSNDEARSWNKPVLATPEAGYFVVNNDRMVQARNGRVLVPVAKAVGNNYYCVAGCFYSDDEGATWQRCQEYIALRAGVGLQEPGIVELADGSLWMYLRTDQGYIYESRSTDGGERWSPPYPTSLVAPCAPASAKCLPGSDDILMIYNDRQSAPYSNDWGSVFHHRTPLAAAVSGDGGHTWQHHQLIETDLTRTYCYTSITFHLDATLLTYYLGAAGGPNLVDLKLKIVATATWRS
ncbi:MAG: sialidase family protein [Anaerolineae bacterium]